MKKALPVVLLALLLVFTVSCRNVIYIPVIDSGNGGSGSTAVDSTTAYQKTFGTVAWDSVIQTAVNQAGDGLVDGMRSTLVEVDSSTVGTASVRALSANALPNGPEVRTTPVEMLLTIFFEGYRDSISGVTISGGTMQFTLTAERTVTTDTETSTTMTKYQVESYTATTTENLEMSGNGASADVSVTEITSTAATMTITVSNSVTVGEDITSATAVNVSMSVSTSTGNVVVNDDPHKAEDIAPETPVIPEPALGSEERPYVIGGLEDFVALMSYMGPSEETFYVEIATDVVIPAELGTIVIGKGYNVDLNLGGHRISRVSTTAPIEATGTPKTYGDSNSDYMLTVDGGTLMVHDGILGGTLFENPVARVIWVDNGGVLYTDNLEVYQFSNTQGTAVNIHNGTGYINGIEIYATYYGLFVDTVAEAEVYDSTICSIASNQLSSQNGDGFAYAVSANGTLSMDSTTVRGIQGAISINGGTGTLESGTKSYVTKDIFEHVPEEYETFYLNWLDTPAESHDFVDWEFFYALYISGEYTESSVYVNGGEYISDGSTATVLVGNTADGGKGEPAGGVINGGTFVNTGSGVVVKDYAGVGPGEYGYGLLTINGGRFKDNKDNTADWLKGFVNSETHKVSESPDDDGYYTVKAL